MKKLATALAFCSAAAFAPAAFTDHIPVAPAGVVEIQARTQLVLSIDDVDILAEGLGRLEGTDHAFGYRSLTLGAYYRLIPNLKLGALYRLQAGARHDDDWIPHVPAPPGWVWDDTTSRLESVLMLDASPRFLLPFLPGRDWVFMVKGRFMYNTFNGQMSILARPSLTWFLMIDREPVLNAALSYEAYFPLNFGSTLLYQGYPYVTLTWHATPELGIELAGAYKTTVWSTSASERQSHGVLYSVPFSSWVVSLGIVYTPSL